MKNLDFVKKISFRKKGLEFVLLVKITWDRSLRRLRLSLRHPPCQMGIRTRVRWSIATFFGKTCFLVQNSNFYDLLGTICHRVDRGWLQALDGPHYRIKQLLNSLWGFGRPFLNKFERFESIFSQLKFWRWLAPFWQFSSILAKISQKCWFFQKISKFQFFRKFLILIRFTWDRSMLLLRFRQTRSQCQNTHRTHLNVMNR